MVRAWRVRMVRARVKVWSGTWMRVYSERVRVRAWSGRAWVRVVGEDADDGAVTVQMMAW